MSKEKASGINWAKVLDLPGMRGGDGSPDMGALLRFLEEDLSSWVLKNEVPLAAIDRALDVVWEKFPELGFTIDQIGHRAYQELSSDVPGGAETRTFQRITDLIRSQTKAFVEGGEGKWFVSRGAGARVQRITPEFSEAYRAKKLAEAGKTKVPG